MKFFSKLSAVGAVLVLGTALAAADTVTFGSYGTLLGQDGVAVAPVAGQNTAVLSGGNATYNIGSDGGSVWSPAGPNSSWVSFNGQTGPTSNFVAPNGTYTYTTTFTVTGGSYYGSISAMADDTTDVLLDGNLLIPAGTIGTDTHCADGAPNCIQPATYNFVAYALSGGVHTLTFNLQQTGLVYEGLDFYGSISTNSPVPEPGTLFLLGTGLVGSAGTLMRRMRASK
ncbi:PEP-CTERM sorting domain-containing protein [Edaphobacter aggregans]|uniref:PEP-CTERM sorting domain-containing protein n=1 Tax=Edaphobacter aggregans TaxID=570835 RepID=UPI00055873BA|nr:PEP-CTERM sorting domain-containing protein [Edaphobacter aggregans]